MFFRDVNTDPRLKDKDLKLVFNEYLKTRTRTSSGAYSMGYGGHVPHYYKWLGTGGTVSRRTANKKLTKLY